MGYPAGKVLTSGRFVSYPKIVFNFPTSSSHLNSLNNSIMSKILLWFGFLLSIPMLLLGISDLANTKVWVLALWSIIFVGAGYKLFFAKAK